MSELKVKNAIISVSDKTGLEKLAKGLHAQGVRIFSTGGTSRVLTEAGVPVTKISDYTGFPEILDGRVKSLHPKIHGGILARKDDPEHLKQMEKNGIIPFDLVVINLYPFEEVIKKPGVTVEEAIENIDIGGPSMLRSSAKNYKYVCVVPDPGYYDQVLKELEDKGSISYATRAQLAMAVFDKTSYYDGLIGSYMHSEIVHRGVDVFPDSVSFYFKKKQDLRYGENPHQRAAFYTNPDIRVSGVAQAIKRQGKELSFNNILDIESAFEIVKEFDTPACSVIKHTNPCGAACSHSLFQSFKDAHACDPLSAFGSIIGCNRKVDGDTARAMLAAGFMECVIAPAFDESAMKAFSVKKNLRILQTGHFVKEHEVYDYDMKRVIGGVLIQSRDRQDVSGGEIVAATVKKVTEEQLDTLLFAWKIAKYVKSNAIVLAQPSDAGVKTVGIGAGQMSRVDAAFLAVSKAGDRASGAVLASDAFFPNPDAIELIAKHGITAVIQPGGSIRDDDVVAACDRAGIAMVYAGMRHFRH